MTSSVVKVNCDRIKQCLRAERAWPSGMEYCPKILVPETVRVRDKDGKWGYAMDIAGCSKDSIITPRFDVAEKFGNNGLAKVSRGGKWGYVNLKAEEVIPLYYDEVGDFDFGLVPVRLSNKWGYFSAQGQIVGAINFDAVSGLWRDGLSAVQVQGKWGFVDPRGDTKIQPDFDKVTEFQKGLAKVEINRRWGVINTTGAFVIEPTFDAIFSTADARLLLVNLDRKYGYYNSDGKEIISPRLVKPIQARYNSGGVQVLLNAAALTTTDSAPVTAASPDVMTNSWYFLNTASEKLRFDEDGKAQFWRNGEWFYISQAGMLLK
ncbi:MAG: WG repeat-containing protein [Azoarcus sp.]|nr:WG repeat-containing protein [Azoarcus sp.]